jgi:glycosidase
MNAPIADMAHVDWSRSASLYEVNLRQYTEAGTFEAFEAHLPRLQRMGVGILWLMPIHPIGVVERKGSLGSPYSVRDHRGVNPEFGDLAALKRLVRAAHALGMHILLDWVANHTAWDHPWVTEHPQWYLKNDAGEICSCRFDNGTQIEEWTDVVGLDYRQGDLRQAMVDAMVYWVAEVGVDGFRCDVAGLVPTPFWVQARAALQAIKPVFMLAEWSAPELHEGAFDMTYGWEVDETLLAVANGRANAPAIAACVRRQQVRFPHHAYRMLFTSNHDLNAWHGSDTERFGAAFKACAVLAATLPGMPLVYGGQEAGLDKRLAFFEKDPIVWGDIALGEFYRRLMLLKQQHPALWNGQYGGGTEFLPVCSETVLAFRRQRQDSSVAVVVNLSPEPTARTLAPWSYQVFAGRPGAELPVALP